MISLGGGLVLGVIQFRKQDKHADDRSGCDDKQDNDEAGKFPHNERSGNTYKNDQDKLSFDTAVLIQFSRFRIADKGFSDDIDYGTRLKNPDTEILSFIRLDFPPTAQ